MNILSILERFPNQTACVEYLEEIRWNGKPVCPYCNSFNIYINNRYQQKYYCGKCRNCFSVTVKSIFHDTKIPLQKWFLAIILFLNAKKGISAKQIQRDLNISYPTAWRMLHQIRKAMSSEIDKTLFTGILEMDETYIGGKPKKSKDIENKSKKGRGTKKTPIVGIVDRDNKKVYAEVALPNKKNQKLTGKQLLNILEKVAENNIIMTDEFKGYNILDKDLRFFRQIINHKFEFSRENIHTNSIESFWAILKRGVYGIYHHISLKYLQRYIDEFTFRYNHRDNDAFDVLLNRCF